MLDEIIARMVATINLAGATIIGSTKLTDDTVRTTLKQMVGEFFVDDSQAFVYSDKSGENARLEKISWVDAPSSAPTIQVSVKAAIDGASGYHKAKTGETPKKAMVEKVIISRENSVWYGEVPSMVAVLAVTLFLKKGSVTYYVDPLNGNIIGEAPAPP